VEHLPYQEVMTLIRLAYRALEEDGIILMATPNVRGLYPHLESFYMHFGHVTFYHPKLLSFFLDHSGFSNPRMGENPRMAHPLWRDVAWMDPDEDVTWSSGDATGASPVRYQAEIPSKYSGAVGRVIGAAKTFAARLLVRPLLDQVVDGANESLGELRRYGARLNDNINDVHRRLMALDRPVECYVYATKGDVDLDLPSELIGEAA
jgi:hypothetical protein